MAGRGQIVNGITRALELDYRDPSLTSIFVSARGTGKTALLTYLGTEARQRGWIVVDSVSRAGMLEDILERGTEAAAEFLSPPARKRLMSISMGGVASVGWENTPAPSRNWRGRMNVLLSELDDKGIGLLITVDEVNPKVPEIAELISTYQLFIRENRKVALLLAGLPGKVLSLLGKEDITFIRRAKRYNLGAIRASEVMSAFADTVKMGGRSIGADALMEATDAIGGFAFMMQAVGYRAWDAGSAIEISLKNMRTGAAIAKQELEDSVLESTALDLSGTDRAFLAAMLEDTGDSAIADIAKRTGKSGNAVQKTRRRLINLGIIGERGRGLLGFELPHFREYLTGRLP